MKRLTKEQFEKMTPEEAIKYEGETPKDYDTWVTFTEKICLYLSAKNILGISMNKEGRIKWYIPEKYGKMKGKEAIQVIQKRADLELSEFAWSIIYVILGGKPSPEDIKKFGPPQGLEE